MKYADLIIRILYICSRIQKKIKGFFFKTLKNQLYTRKLFIIIKNQNYHEQFFRQIRTKRTKIFSNS